MSTDEQHRRLWLRVLSLVAIAFGLLTLEEGGMTLAGNAEALNATGHHVLFVL